MKNTQKYVATFVLTAFTLMPLSSFAETSTTVSIPKEAKFCSKFNTISTKLQDQIANTEAKKKENEINNEKKIADKEALVDAKRASGRITADEKRIKNFDKANTKAKTTEQKAAVEAYQKAITEAVSARRLAIDTAAKTYRDGVAALMTTKSTEIDSSINSFKDAVVKATEKANTDCANKVPDKTVSIEFNKAIKDARTALSNSKKTFSKSTEMKNLKTTRDASFKEAESNFKNATDKARADLLIAMK